MLSTKNSDPSRCAKNLLAIVRGEVPYDRIRGLDAKLIDRPTSQSAAELNEDALWMLATYEPRVEVDAADIGFDDTTGEIRVVVKFK